MKLLVIGSGGREHALVRTLARATGISVTCAPGNAGIAADARVLPIESGAMDELSRARRSRALRSHGGGSRVAARSRPRRSLSRARPPHLRSLARRRSARVQQGVRQGVHDAPRHSHRAVSRLRLRRRRAQGDRARRARPAGRDQGRRPRGGKGRRRCRRSCRGRRAIRAAMEERQFGHAGARVVIEECLSRSRGVVLCGVRRPEGDTARLGSGSQARVRRRPRAEYRRDGGVRAEPADGRRRSRRA